MRCRARHQRDREGSRCQRDYDAHRAASQREAATGGPRPAGVRIPKARRPASRGWIPSGTSHRGSWRRISVSVVIHCYTPRVRRIPPSRGLFDLTMIALAARSLRIGRCRVQASWSVQPIPLGSENHTAMSHAIKVLPQRPFGICGDYGTMIETEELTVRMLASQITNKPRRLSRPGHVCDLFEGRRFVAPRIGLEPTT